MNQLKSFLESYFDLINRKTSISKEVIAGLTTFSAMSYILIVNPLILSSAGMDRDSLITATAISAMVGTLIMALWANLPIALAAGMGSNVIFASVVVQQVGASWQVALTMVFVTGVLFVLLSLSSLREKIMKGFPEEIQLGLQLAIGIFIAYLGLKNSGLVISNESTYIAFGNISSPATLLTFIGLILTPVLMVKKIPGAFLISISALTIIGLFIPDSTGAALTKLPEQIIDFPKLSSEQVFAFDFQELWNKIFVLLPIAIYFFLSDFFSTAATLIGATQRGNLIDDEGNIPKARAAFSSDAIATVVGATLGTSTVTSFIESVTGIEAGGRTGLTSLVVAFMFFIAMFFWPIFTIIPAEATAPTLILVGVLMLEGVKNIKSERPEQTYAPLLTLLMTACTADLMIGLSTGCFVYTVIIASNREWKKLTPMLLFLNITLIGYIVLNSKLSLGI